MKIPTLEQIMARTRNDPSGCIIWLGAKDGKGYGNIGRMNGGQKKNWILHRLVYELATGTPLPRETVLHHFCMRRDCVNVAHLEPMTQAEHNIRCHPGNIAKAIDAKIRATHCWRGHSLDDAYVHAKTGYRQCRECRRINDRKRGKRRWQQTLEARVSLHNGCAD